MSLTRKRVQLIILETLFGIVRRCELKACRAVCKKWNLRTIPHMRATFKVTIDDDNALTTFVKLFTGNEFGIPFTKFRLGPFCTTDGVGQVFLQLCEEIATDIVMDGGLLDPYTIEDVSELLRRCPNLKVLGFPSRLISHSGNVVKLFTDATPTFSLLKKINFRHGFVEPLDCCPSGIEELITAAPNVSDVIVSDIDRSSGGEYGNKVDSKISAVLNCIEKLGKESSILSLHLDSVRLGHIEHLRKMNEKEKGLKLKNLTFKKYTHSQDFVNVPIQLTAIFKDTLQSLNVDLVTATNLMEFPFMPHLKSLAFKANSTALKPVNLSQKFPVLETLEIGLELYGNRSQLFSQYNSSPTIKSLRISRDMRTQTFQDILSVFPNLTKLDLSVAEDGVAILREIWSEMTELESLSISVFIGGTVNEALDSLFTGIPTQTLKEILPFLHGHVFDRMTVQEKTKPILGVTEHYSRLPSIRNLTKLRHLDLNVGGATHLSDVTAYLAFYPMNHLRHLNVKGCIFSKTCCEILTEEMGLESWDFRNEESKHIIPPFLLH